ncbi:hypothetical protein [Thermocoleostomius sinensis]|uniref:Uncharacterized protein n=1 Tax=Thermocoleostomius sinensis A174 TaxID=2016057 RepID=A0A9E8ZIQ4_9CYAN|nr:hypothetical protein [Thermocoleostomius sinensis]WAL59261.1 hypothetical protein OXH18_19100 [Thermocoleostomius sinensis A174]
MSDDWDRIGVLTTHINFSNVALLTEVLDRTLISQQAFLAPYIAGFIQAFQQSQEQFVVE